MHNTAYFEGYDGIVGITSPCRWILKSPWRRKSCASTKVADCEQTWLGYWDQDAIVVPYSNEGWSDKRPRVTVELNGKKMVAIIATGAERTMVFRNSTCRHPLAIPTRETAAPLNSNWATRPSRTHACNPLIIQNGGSKANEADMVLGGIGRAAPAVAVAAPAQGLFLLFGRRLVQRR
jgi:hypothetical protein